jgi:hypothetical protein
VSLLLADRAGLGLDGARQPELVAPPSADPVPAPAPADVL